MKKILQILLSVLFLVSCSDKKQLIPTEELEKIITETLLSDAILRQDPVKIAREFNTESDSLDIYAPILAKYGYNIRDFEYSISVYVLRKSNPLDNIFKNVLDAMTMQEAAIKDRYTYLLRFDTAAMNRYADTIFVMDTTLRGGLNDHYIQMIPAKAGVYNLRFTYAHSMDPNIGSKHIKIEATSRDKNVRKESRNYWLTKRDIEIKFDRSHTVSRLYDTLKISFEGSLVDKKKETKDTTKFMNLQVIYYPPLEKAVQDYFYEITGLSPSYIERYEKKFATYLDSIVIPYDFRQAPPEKWRDTIRSEWKSIKSANRRR